MQTLLIAYNFHNNQSLLLVLDLFRDLLVSCEVLPVSSELEELELLLLLELELLFSSESVLSLLTGLV
jgi:hypothetical protein